MFGYRKATVYILTALFALLAPVWGTSLRADAQVWSGPEDMVRAAAEEVLREAEPIERDFRQRALDPEGADAIISASGKALTREDGK